MMNLRKNLFIILNGILFLFLTLNYGFAEDPKGHIVITVSQIKNDSGLLRISLFDSKDGFPNKFKQALKFINRDSESPETKITFPDIPFGEYAIAILHDENNNEKMDTNFLRMPKEGYGVSNNVRGSFGPPKFEDAKFLVEQDSVFLSIEMSY